MKGFSLFVAAAVCVLLCSVTAFATLEESGGEELFDLSGSLEALGAEELERELPDEAREWMENNDIQGIDLEQIRSLTPGKLLSSAYQSLKEQLTQPLRTLLLLVGIVVLAAFFEGIRTAELGHTLSPVFGVVTTLCVSAALVTPVIGCIRQTAEAVTACARFMLSFIPVFCGVMAVSGQPLTAGTFSLFLFGTCQVISQIISTMLVPMMEVYLAFCIFGSVMPTMKIGDAAKGVKTVVSWALGLMLSVFVGLLSVQGMVSSSGDTAAVKAAKFVIGSFVPVVGSALSDAFAAAQGSLNLLRATLGAYGIIAAVFTFMPVFLRVTLWYVGIGGVGVLSDMFGLGQVGQLLKAISTTLGMLMAVILSVGLLVVVSTSMMLALRGG